MAAYALGRAPYPGVGGYSGECMLFLRLGSAWSLFTRLRLKMREEKKHLNYAAVFFGHFTAPLFAGIASRHRSKEQKIMLNYDLCGNDVFKLAHASLALQFFLVGTSPWNPPAPST